MSICIRPAAAADTPDLVKLLRHQMEEHFLPASERAMAGAVGRVFDWPKLGRFVVAVEGETIVGVAYVAFLHSMEHSGTIPLLEELYVVAEKRGQGVGTALLRQVIEEFSAVPGKPMELEVDVSHEGVETFYERHGFTQRRRTRWIFNSRRRGGRFADE